MVNKNNCSLDNIESLEVCKREAYYEDLAVRYSNIEGKLITAKNKTEFLDRVFKVAAQLIGVTVNMVKEQHYDDIEDSWAGKGTYQVVFRLYDFGQEIVIDINLVDKVTNAEGERHENY